MNVRRRADGILSSLTGEQVRRARCNQRELVWSTHRVAARRDRVLRRSLERHAALVADVTGALEMDRELFRARVLRARWRRTPFPLAGGAQPGPIHVAIRWRGEAAVVQVQGVLNFKTVPILDEALAQALEGAHTVVDLSGTTGADISVYRDVGRWHRYGHQRGHRLVLAVLPRRMRVLLKALQLEERVTIFDSVEEALESLTGAGPSASDPNWLVVARAAPADTPEPVASPERPGPPAPLFACPCEDPPGTLVTILRPVGDIDLATAGGFGEALSGPLAAVRHAIVDLERIHYIDSSGFQMLLRLQERYALRALRLSLAAPSRFIARLIQNIGLTQTLPCFPTVEAALEREREDSRRDG